MSKNIPRKTVKLNQAGIQSIPNYRPVKYQIETQSGNVNYVGTAKRGRAASRIAEHLPNQKDAVPGSRVRIEEFRSIAEAQRAESRSIRQLQPKYNKKGK